MGVWEGLVGGMKGTDQSVGPGNGYKRSLAGLSEYNPLGPVILFVGPGQCAEVPPTPQVGGFSASCPLWGHPCPDEVNSSFPIATNHESLSPGKCDMSIPDVPVVP